MNGTAPGGVEPRSLHIAVYHNLPSGGAKRSLHEVLRRLSTRHTFEVFTLSTADRDFADLRPLAPHHVAEFTPSHEFHSPFGRLNRALRLRDLRRLQRVNAEIARRIDAGGFDAAFVHPCTFTQGPTVLEELHTPSVYFCQEPLRLLYEPEIARPYRSESRLRRAADRGDPLLHLHRRALRALDRDATRSAARVLVNSCYSADNVRRIYGMEPEVCYFGVDTVRFRPNAAIQRSGAVLSVGALRANKGFDFLIQALGMLPQHKRPALRIIGNADFVPERHYLDCLAQTHGVVLQIETQVSDERLVQAYNEAVLVVYTPVREPFGFVPIEAMACATPVVGVAEGGVCETVVDGVTGRLTPRDPVAFAAAVEELLDDPARRHRYGQQGRAHVCEQWTWERSAAQIEQALAEVAARGRT